MRLAVDMPIDPETFAEGETTDSVQSKILELLYDNPQRAYNVREIAIEVNTLTPSACRCGRGYPRARRRGPGPRARR
jgi:hypothetical protein